MCHVYLKTSFNQIFFVAGIFPYAGKTKMNKAVFLCVSSAISLVNTVIVSGFA